MPSEKPTLGQAIDHVIAALEPLEPTARETALGAVCAHLGIALKNATTAEGSPLLKGAVEKPGSGTAHSNDDTPKDPPRVSRLDIRTLKEQKKPSSAREMACLVAFYLQEHAPEGERKDTITAGDLDKYFKQAGFKLPQRLDQLLVDAKGSGYLDSSGRGAYKLNAVGYNLVAHTLPKTAGDK